MASDTVYTYTLEGKLEIRESTPEKAEDALQEALYEIYDATGIEFDVIDRTEDQVDNSEYP